MSGSSAPKQDTINRWCNPEAIMAYAGRLRNMARDDREREAWGDEPNGNAMADKLVRAANLLEGAARAAGAATHEHHRAASDRMYARMGR